MAKRAFKIWVPGEVGTAGIADISHTGMLATAGENFRVGSGIAGYENEAVFLYRLLKANDISFNAVPRLLGSGAFKNCFVSMRCRRKWMSSRLLEKVPAQQTN